MDKPRVLIANDTLHTRFGAELVTRDLALGFAALGNAPIVYAPKTGSVAEEIRQAGILVVDDLIGIAVTPDIVLGNQHLETIDALMAFPHARGVFICHSGLGWPATPPLTNRIQLYVAVDHFCRERLTSVYSIPPERVRVIFNSVDTDRFRQRSVLPDQPRRALVFSNYAAENNFLAVIRTACHQAELPLDVIGAGVHNLIDHPEEVLPNYDVVFAKARCALEAMAVGNAVILCDESGLGPMVSFAEVAELRPWNFGMRTLQSPITPGRIARELERYDPADARRVSDYIRSQSSTARLVPEYISIFEQVMTMPIPTTGNALIDYHRATIQRISAFESDLYFHKQFRMEPLTASAASEISLTDARVSASLRNQHLWVECKLSNPTSVRLGSFAPAPVCLAYHWFDANGDIAVFEGLRTLLTPALDPGSSDTYEMKVAAPSHPGKYRLRVTLVQEGVRWFDELPEGAFVDLPLCVS